MYWEDELRWSFVWWLRRKITLQSIKCILPPNITIQGGISDVTSWSKYVSLCEQVFTASLNVVIEWLVLFDFSFEDPDFDSLHGDQLVWLSFRRPFQVLQSKFLFLTHPFQLIIRSHNTFGLIVYTVVKESLNKSVHLFPPLSLLKIQFKPAQTLLVCYFTLC